MAVPLGWGSLNNQPHIHLTSLGYLLGPNPLLKGSKRKGFSHADSILIWKSPELRWIECRVAIFVLFLTAVFCFKKLPSHSPKICSQFSPAVFVCFFGGTGKKNTRKGGPVFGRGSSSSRWFLAPESEIATGFWGKSVLGGLWTNPFEKYARQVGSSPQVGGENKKYLKPPTRVVSNHGR